MIHKLLFIDSSVPEKEVLISNINTEQVKIVKDRESLTDVNLEGITHIAFAWKNYWIGTIKPRFPLFSFSLNSDNDNLYQQKTIKEIAKNFPELQNIDLITCNLNEDENSEWNDAFSELKQGLSETINVRYSINRTGSATLQGDWILESHNINILDEYFANKDFVYNHHLAIPPFTSLEDFVNAHSELSITGNTLNLNGDIDIDGATWETLIINDTDTIAMGTPTAPAGNYNINCIDGNGHTITFTGMNNTIESLFFNGTGINDSNNLREIVIKNLIVDGDASNSFKGIVYSIRLFCPAQKVVVKNCGVENLQINNSDGAIFGRGAGYESYVKAIACYSTGNISENSGGIYGEYAGEKGSVYVIACYSTGTIGNYAGGICGSVFATRGRGIIIGCYSTGTIEGEYAGGICGIGYGNICESVKIISCYSIGTIKGEGSGGICGSQAGYDSNLSIIIACYSTGNIEGIDSGGICGEWAGRIGNLSIISCYSMGTIKGDGSGGICGSQANRSVDINNRFLYIIACYSTGNIDGNNCGGICGYEAGYILFVSASTNVSIITCYSTGNISNSSSGSGNILGNTSNLSNINIQFTYAIRNNCTQWAKYNTNSGSNEIYDPIDNTNKPDPKLFKYDTSKTIKNQLELRFFRSLPWDPRSPIPQRPFLLDWSTCDFEKVFYDKWFDTNDAWYINNDFNFDNPITLENVKDLLTNLNNSDLPLDNYEPNDYVDCIKLEPIDPNDIQLCDMVLVYNSGITTIIRVTEITENRINGTYKKNSNTFYRINTKYPIYSEFINNSSIENPFELNYNCIENYDIAEANWRGFNLCKPVIKPNYNCCIPIKNKCNHILGMDYLTQFLI